MRVWRVRDEGVERDRVVESERWCVESERWCVESER